MRQESAASIAVRLRAGRSGVRIPARAKDLFFSKTLEPSQPPSQWVPGFSSGGVGWGVKLNTHPSRAEVKNEWSFVPTSSIYLHGKDMVYFLLH
jgi:hypothetical protein